MKKLFCLLVVIVFCLSICGITYAAQATADKGKVEKPQTDRLFPKKVSIDTVGDGKPHRFEYYDAEGNIAKVEMDSKGDGIIDESITYEKGKPVKGWKDTKRIGKPDVWIDY
jgi:hypothetical protein